MQNYFSSVDNVSVDILPNGLKIYCVPKYNHNKTIGMLTVNFGSIDTQFISAEGGVATLPYGTAHFLEHKLFEKEKEDLFSSFYSNNAIPNAFTTYTRTSYLFSTKNNIERNLQLLLDLADSPFFSEESVFKEKKIIKQEINMYDDQVDNILLTGILNNMYNNHSIGFQICGNDASINKISEKDLNIAFDQFYHPKNMYILLVGNIDKNSLIELIAKNYQNRIYPDKVINTRLPFQQTSIQNLSSCKMDVIQNKVMIGIKVARVLISSDSYLFNYKLCIQLLLEILLGDLSDAFEYLSSEHIIDAPLIYAFYLDKSFHFVTILGNCNNTAAFIDYIRNILITFETNSELNEKNLALAKKKIIGKFLRSLDSIDDLVMQFQDNLYGDHTYLETKSFVDVINLDDLFFFGRELFVFDNFSAFFVSPNYPN